MQTPEKKQPAKFSAPSRVKFRSEAATDKPSVIENVIDGLGVCRITANILASRGVSSSEEAHAFLSPTLRDHLPEPSQIKNIEPAAELILDAIDAKKHITIFTDFDVDGVSSGSQLLLYLECLGASVSSYTPNRFQEGYGLSLDAVEKLAHSGTQVLVTVDCGISSNKEIALAKRLGLSVVVIDHHIPSALPPADVIVDPAQEGCPFADHELAAAGLVWMFLIVLRQAALKRRSAEDDRPEPLNPKAFLDLAVLGTICDMVPLVGLNRVIAHRGVDALNTTSRPGLIALKNVSGIGDKKKISSGQVSFGIGPRINAAGRLGDAKEVVKLLTTGDSLQAKKIAESINRLNTERRSIEERVKSSCIEMIERNESLQQHAAFALYGKDFHIGVIGIAAQRIVEHFHRPAAIMGPGEAIIDGEVRQVVKGSVRSINGFHIANVLESLSEYLVSQGGHAQAGGFTVTFDKLEVFQEAFVAAANKILSTEQLQRVLTADLEVGFDELDYKLVDELQSLAPFGMGNPSPVLVTEKVTIGSVTLLTGDHVKLRVSKGNHHINAIAWGYKGHPLFRKGNVVGLAYSPELNTYRGVSSVQLNIKDIWSV